jgi:UDP-N-acetylmuramyl pentapeptide phosphotransferase/UDP-N-acetylglucosamine-1-phosphate transferase
MNSIITFILLTVTSYGLVFLVRRWVNRLSILDIPNERSSHSNPTPRGGGLVIVILTLFTILVYCLVNGAWKEGLVYIAGGSILAYLGWRDDVRSMPARVRFFIQGLVAIGTVAGLGYFDTLPFPFSGGIHLGIFGILMTIIWIIGLTNAYNFMDGIDGIAGGVAAAGGVGWMILILLGAGLQAGMAFWIALAIAAVSLGFLGHNWSPAKIFMGDVGSVFLGYSFAVLPLLVENKASQPLMMGVMVMWVFIMDSGITFIRRVFRRERVFSAHRSHLYQRLVIGGMSHEDVSLIYIILSLAGVLLAKGWLKSYGWNNWLILVGLPVFWAIFYIAGSKNNGWIRLKGYISLYQSMGFDWVLFRIRHTIRKELCIIRRESPAYTWKDAPLETRIKTGIPLTPVEFAEWRMKHAPAWIFGIDKPLPQDVPWDEQAAVNDAERVLSGEWKYFSHDWVKTGFPPDWHIDAVSGTRFDPSIHWTKISETGNYDIKLAWEASRLSMVYTLVRAYAYTKDERYPEAFWHLVEDWMDKNQLNRGVNWIDGQEAALRLLAVCFGSYAFRKAESTSPERVVRLTILAGALGKKISQNVDFAIHSRTNHAISVAFGLWLCGLVFPELKEAEQYLSRGKALFETEVEKQIFADGGYAMYSINYQRFVLQLTCLALRLGELNQRRFSDSLYEKLGKSADFLAGLVEPSNGEVPVFGSNDGALVLPLNNCDYYDYRPTLQLVNYLTRHKKSFPDGPWDEDLYWFYGQDALDSERAQSMILEHAAFPDAGIYVLRGENSKAVLRCTEYRGRPSHADQLHMDFWWQEVNIACDAGTYLYHGEGIWQNGLARTNVHNTVCVDGADQMVHLSRFTWGNWAQGKVLQNGEVEGEWLWQGEHDGYLRLNDPVKHSRKVVSLGGDRWLVVDKLLAAQPHEYCLQWLLADQPYEVVDNPDGYEVKLDVNGKALRIVIGLNLSGEFSVARGDDESTRGWQSSYYGEKHPALSVMLTAKAANTTFWTLFVPEGNETLSLEKINTYLAKTS